MNNLGGLALGSQAGEHGNLLLLLAQNRIVGCAADPTRVFFSISR